MSVESDENEFKQYLEEAGANNVEIGDIKGKTDYYEVVSRAAYLASEFGMGGCATFTEFLDMVKNEDPILVNALTVWISCKYRRMYGDDDTKGPPKRQDMPTKASVEHKAYPKGYSSDLFQFAKEHGYNSQEIQEIEEKVKSGQINGPSEEFNITPDQLQEMSSEEFNELLSKMNEYVGSVKNVKLDLHQWEPADGGAKLTGGAR